MRRVVTASLCFTLSVTGHTSVSAQERIARLSLDEAVSLALLDTVDYAYPRGGVSLIDFRDAQRTYRETSLEYLRALGSHHAALYQLDAAVRGPLED